MILVIVVQEHPKYQGCGKTVKPEEDLRFSLFKRQVTVDRHPHDKKVWIRLSSNFHIGLPSGLYLLHRVMVTLCSFNMGLCSETASLAVV